MMSVFANHDDVERARIITMTSAESARISAEMAEFDNISRRLHAEAADLAVKSCDVV